MGTSRACAARWRTRRENPPSPSTGSRWSAPRGSGRGAGAPLGSSSWYVAGDSRAQKEQDSRHRWHVRKLLWMTELSSARCEASGRQKAPCAGRWVSGQRKASPGQGRAGRIGGATGLDVGPGLGQGARSGAPSAVGQGEMPFDRPEGEIGPGAGIVFCARGNYAHHKTIFRLPPRKSLPGASLPPPPGLFSSLPFRRLPDTDALHGRHHPDGQARVALQAARLHLPVLRDLRRHSARCGTTARSASSSRRT